MNSLKCPKAKSLSHCLTELFPIYQNNIWTIRQWDDHTIIPSSHRILLKIVGFLVKRPRARTSDLPEVIQPKSCESFYSTPPLTRFFGPGKNRVKGKPRYRRSILVLKPQNGEFETLKSTFSIVFTSVKMQLH